MATIRGDAEVEVLHGIETEMAVLARSLELLRRRSRIHRRMDRSAYLLLRTLDEAGPLPLHALAQRVGLDASTVTRQVATLEANGFAERRSDPTDRRCCIVVPSAQGRDLMHEVQRQRSERFEEMLAGWSAADRAELGRLLAQLNQAINVHALQPDPDEEGAGRVDARRDGE